MALDEAQKRAINSLVTDRLGWHRPIKEILSDVTTAVRVAKEGVKFLPEPSPGHRQRVLEGMISSRSQRSSQH